MKKFALLTLLTACIGLSFGCTEKTKPEYHFPTPKTTPTATISPIEKGIDYIIVRINSIYATECAYLYAEGETLSKSQEAIFAEGTLLQSQSEEIKIEGLKPETAYTFIAAAKDERLGSVCAPITVITASDAPESNYPKKVEFEELEYTFEDGNKAVVYVTVADLGKNKDLRFLPTHLKPAQTPTDAFSSFAELGMGTPYVVTNGGFFWDGASLSLCITDGEVKSIASELAYPNDADGNQIIAYPVRAALGQMADGSFEATWVYCINDVPYSFPSPLDNDEATSTFMPAPPTPETEGAELWEPMQAIGGGPMLVYKGKNVAMEYYYREIMHTGGTAGESRQPRTAVGGTRDGKVMLLVCDGRNMNGSAGLTLSEMADIFVEYGMEYAINLDGGGSSAIVGYDGQLCNMPSDESQRAVPTVVVLSEVE